MDRTTTQDVDAYYADILDIPALRDSGAGNYSSTDAQVKRLQHPTQGIRGVDDAVYMDRFFNNSPYTAAYDSDGSLRMNGPNTFVYADTQVDSEAVPGASILELWAGEMRALSRKEMSGEGLSPKELELLRSYQDYFSGRTGMAEGGVVVPRDDLAGISGLFADRAVGGPKGPRPAAPLDSRTSAVGLSLFQQAGIQASPEQLTQMVDDAIFAQLDRIMARSQRDEMSRVPDTYFPQDGRGISAPQY